MKNNFDVDIEDDRLRAILEEKFRKLNKELEFEAPPELKQQVFSTLSSLTILGDMLDLFVIKFAQAELTLLDPSIQSDWGDSEEKDDD